MSTTSRFVVATPLLLLAALGCSSASDVPGTAETVGQRTDPACISGPAFPSCYGQCGHLTCSPGLPTNCCACDAGCDARGDCCCDYADYCVAPPEPPPSCEGHCGGAAPEGCFCDDLCTGYGDCCGDFETACVPDDLSCDGHCGGAAPGGCYCDAACTGYGDCCSDFAPTCIDWPKIYGGAGEDTSGGLAVNPTGHVFSAGQLASAWDFGGGAAVGSANDSVVTSWDQIGFHRWTTVLQAVGGGQVVVRGAAADNTRVFLVGTSSAPIRVGSSTVWTPPATGSHPFVLALTASSGSFSWSANYPGYDSGNALHVELAPSGRLAVVGDLRSWWTTFASLYEASGALLWTHLGGTPQTHSMGVDASDRILTAPYDGRYARFSRTDATGSLWYSEVARSVYLVKHSVADDGAFSMVGNCESAGCDFSLSGGPSALHPSGSTVARFSVSGSYQWSRSFPNVRFVDVRMRDNGQTTSLGVADGVVNLGGGALGVAGRKSLVLVEHSISGAHLNSRLVAQGTTASSAFPSYSGRYHLAGPEGTTRFVAGSFSGAVNITGQAATTAGDSDGFVANMN